MTQPTQMSYSAIDDINELYNSSPFPMGVCTIEGDDIRHLSDNKAAAHFFGKTQQLTKGSLASEIGASKEVIQNWIRNYRLAEDTNSPVAFEYNHPSGDKTLLMSATVSYLGRNPQGLSKFSYLVQNITEVRNTELNLKLKLQEREQIFTTMVQNMTEEINIWQLVYDSAGNIKTWKLVYANPPTLKTWGKKLEDIQDKTTEEIFGLEALEHYMPIVRKIFQDQAPYTFEDYFPALDKYFRLTSIPLGDRFFSTGLDITAVKKTQLYLQQSEERLKLALTAARLGVYERDLITGNVIWSPEAKIILGHQIDKPEEDFEAFQGRRDLSTREKFQKDIQEAIGQGTVDIDYRFHKPDGELRWLHAYGKVINDMDGRPIRSIGVLQDVTDRKKIEEALKERELDVASERAKLHSLLLQAPAIFSLTRGPDHVFEIFNNEACKSIGGKDCTGLPIRKALPELEGKGFFESLDHVYQSGEPLHMIEAPADLVQPDGSVQTQYFNVLYHPWRGPKGNIEGIMNVSVDVTEQVKARKKLELAEAELRILVNTIPQLAWMANADGAIYWYNDNWYKYTGTSAKEMEGWGWQIVHDPNILPQVLEKWGTSIQTGKLFEMEFPLKDANGNFRWFLTRVSPLKDRDGKVIKWFGTNTDIDEQRRIRDELNDAIRARDEFLSIASHELKTPLTSLLLHTQLLERSINADGLNSLQLSKVEQFVKQVSKQSLRLNRLVEDMLDISRIRSGKLTINKETVDLCEIVKEVLERMKQVLHEAGTVPYCTCPPHALGQLDRMRIEQVLINLLTNAMKYGNQKPIRIIIESLKDKLRLKVHDQGIGISTEAQSRIFALFERDISANEVSGFGLGLFISKEIVESHGGKIWAESKGPGLGSTFIVELPLH